MTTTLRTAANDLVLPRVLVTDPAQVAAQTINDGLGVVAGEWFLDANTGFPWFSFLGAKIINTNQLQSALRSFLLGVPGIAAIVSLVASFDRVARAFSYSYACTVNTGATVVGGSSQPAQVQGGASQ
jgi:hypothetical protein